MLAIGRTVIEDRTIEQAAQGVADYLELTVIRGKRRVVVARDPQPQSERLSRRLVGVLTANGIQVTYFSHPRSAAALSFAVRRLEASAGVMVSAAREASTSDRLECYGSRGSRALGSEVSEIVQRVESVEKVRQESFLDAFSAGRVDLQTQELEEAYVAAVVSESLGPFRDLSILVTPMFGAGEYAIVPVLKRANFQQVDVFQSERMIQQGLASPPGSFPDLEDPRAFGGAIEEARRRSSDLVLGSDLDGGRLRAAVRTHRGEYVVLTSGQIAALVCDYVLLMLRKAKRLGPRHFIVNSPVGTDLLRRIAGHYGLHMRHDLPVGFEYIAREIDIGLPELFAFAADESYGYLKGTYCREKDAAVAALLLAEHAAALKFEGRTLVEELDALYIGHGFHADTTIAWSSRDDREEDDLFHDFSSFPPEQIGGMRLMEVIDYARQQARSIPNNQPIEPEPSFQDRLLLFRFEKKEDGFAVRPLPREPVLKLYLFTYSQCGGPDRLVKARETAQSRLQAMREGLIAHLAEAAQRVAETRLIEHAR